MGSNSEHVIGHVEAIFRYPVKSMRGEPLESVDLGWHGLDGDRRFALRRLHDCGGFPWLTASTLAALLLFSPVRPDPGDAGGLPTHVRTPVGADLPILGQDLADEIARRHGAPVQMLRLDRGIFDDASVSVIATDTVQELGRLADRALDVRRFRPNVVVRPLRSEPFQEDSWLAGRLSFGSGAAAATVAVTRRDVRCSMVCLDPDSALTAPEVLRAVVRANENHAGIYATVLRVGRIEVGQAVHFHPA